MSLPRFFSPVISGEKVELAPEEARHAQAARRLKPGAPVEVFDGRGCEASGCITHADRRVIEVEISEVRHRPFEYPTRLTLATAVPKPPRQGFMVEKLTELGVAEIWPLECRFSVAVASNATVERWRRTSIEAGKQSGAAWLPIISASQSFADAVKRAGEFGACRMASSQGATVNFATGFRVEAPCSLLVFVGPEGGWHAEELALATEHGLTFVGLGPRILRIETACVAVAAALATLADAAPDR